MHMHITTCPDDVSRSWADERMQRQRYATGVCTAHKDSINTTDISKIENSPTHFIFQLLNEKQDERRGGSVTLIHLSKFWHPNCLFGMFLFFFSKRWTQRTFYFFLSDEISFLYWFIHFANVLSLSTNVWKFKRNCNDKTFFSRSASFLLNFVCRRRVINDNIKVDMGGGGASADTISACRSSSIFFLPLVCVQFYFYKFYTCPYRAKSYGIDSRNRNNSSYDYTTWRGGGNGTRTDFVFSFENKLAILDKSIWGNKSSGEIHPSGKKWTVSVHQSNNRSSISVLHLELCRAHH